MTVIIENMVQWNTIANCYGDFLKCDWWNCKPVVCAEEKCLTILCKSKHVFDAYPSGEGLEFLRGTEQRTRYYKIISFVYSYQRVNRESLASVLQSRRQCALHDWWRLRDWSSITSNRSDDSQNSLATITI